MKKMLTALVVTCLAIQAWAGQPEAAMCNMIVNPNFDRTFAARRLPEFTEPDMPTVNQQYRRLPSYEDTKQFLPYAWDLLPNRDGAGVVSLVEEDGSRHLRIRTKTGERITLRQCYIEVVPEGTYTCAVSIKGKGSVTLHGFAENPAVYQNLDSAGGQATANWAKLSVPVKIGYHRHLAGIYIDIGEDADVLLRGGEFSTNASAAATPESLVSTKPIKDKDTLYFEDFEGDKTPFTEGGQAKLTDAHGGRFGRGLEVTPTAGGAKAKLTFGRMPKSGTIEFWYMPAALPKLRYDNKTPLILQTQIPDRSFTGAEFEMGVWQALVSFGFRMEQWHGSWAQAPGTGGWGWWQPGTWHHFAGSWNQQVMRSYVDGVLNGVCYGKDNYGKNVEFPNGEAMELVLPTAGVVDEIRVSNICRFGPIVPSGVTNPSFLSGQPPAEEAVAVNGSDTARPRLETAEKDLDQVRAKAIVAIPDPKAAFVFGADKAKPVWEGMGGMELAKDYFAPTGVRRDGKGADGVAFSMGKEDTNPGFTRPSAFYWKMEGLPDALAVNAGSRAPGLGKTRGQLRVKAGKYHLGLWMETQNTSFRTEYSVRRLLTMLYLNGYPVRFSTTSDPVQVAPGIWLAELQSADAVELKNNDELAVRCDDWPTTVFLRLALHSSEPHRGHGVTGQTFGVMASTLFSRLRLSVEAEIKGSGQAGAELEASIKVANPLPYPVDAVVDWKVADYFGAPVVGKAEPIRLEAHAVKTISQKFTAQAGAQAYQLDVKTRPADGFVPPVTRSREMIELNDWTQQEFLPNLPGPLETWTHTRRPVLTSNAAPRMVLVLDGPDWESTPLVGRRVPQTSPADKEYKEKLGIPNGRRRLDKDVFGIWYRKKFSVPAWMKGQTFLIDLRQLHWQNNFTGEATIFMNGQRLPNTWGENGEFFSCCTDVTKAIKPDAQNELAILLRGGVSKMPDDYVDKYDPANGREYDAKQEFAGATVNESNLSSVALLVMPDVRIRQTLVVPDVEQGSLMVLTRVENCRQTPCTVELRYQAFQEGKAVDGAVIGPQTVSLKPGEVVEVRAKGSGKGLRPYTPRDPVLCKLATTIAEKGEAIDVQDQRFGYRAMKVKDGQLSLNGHPITLLGCGFEQVAQFFEGESDTQTSRGLYNGANFGDEIGRLTYPIITVSSIESWEKLNNDRFWQRERANAVETVWAEGNHPCHVGWDLWNETYHYACYQVGLDGQAKGGERYFSLVQDIQKKIWPDFWFLSDGNDSLGNRLNFTSWHYENQGWVGGIYSAPRGYSRDGDKGTSHYSPDCFFLDGAASPPLPDTIVHGTNPTADDWKPGMACSANEEFWFVGEHNGPAIAQYIGDRAAVSPAWQFFSGRGMWWGRLSVQGYRDIRASVCGVYPINFLNTVMQAVTFTMPAQEVRYYSGAKFERRLNIHDDEFAPGSLEFTWKLTAADGKEVVPGQTLKMESSTSYINRTTLAFTVPVVDTRTEFVLDMTLSKNGKVREHEQRIVEVWPASGAPVRGASETHYGASTNNVALFDPEGKTQAVLERFGYTVKPIQAITSEALEGSRVLIIGPDCVKGQMPAEQQVLRQFVSAGGRVLVLPQQETGLIPVDTSIEKRNCSSLGFVITSNHPIMQGLKDRDFAMWNPGHLVAKDLYRVPSRGNFMPLVECYYSSMAWSPLWELYLGNGYILAVQLPLLEDMETEPMAAEMWRRLLDYMAKDVLRHAETKLALWDGASGGVLTRLKELRADFETVKTLDAKPAVAMVELNQKDFGPQTEVFRKYVQDGGTLVLHRARPEHKEWLEGLTGRKVSVEVQPYRSWVDRQMLEKRDGLAQGLTNIDFYWRPNVDGEGADSVGQVSAGLADGKGQVEYVVKVDGAQEYFFPGGWVEMKLGSGRIVIDQVKWELPEKDMNYYGSPMRVASIFLTNLGVTQRPPAPRPTLPDNVKYQTIDLAKVVNRGLVDDKSNDGIGWLDWGPDQDLRDFPTGDVNLGVPFHVTKGDKNAVVLRADKGRVPSLADYPQSVTIPIKLKNVGGLWFLHTGGWAPGAATYAWREIHYADGSKVSMGLNSMNFADWNYGHDNFPDEEETTTTVAWKGACKMYPVTRVYKTLWVNPCPDKEITEVVLTTKGLPAEECRFVAHLGVTAAILPEKTASPISQGGRDAKKSQSLLQEGIALHQAKKTAEAITKLEAAIQADGRNVGAWMTLTEIHAATDNVEAFTSLCKRWFTAMPDSHQAHNVLGKYLESKGKLADALAEYKKSLEIEWNQPPTIEAKARIQKLLNQK